MLVTKIRGRIIQDPHHIIAIKALVAPVLLFLFHLLAIHMGAYAIFHWFDIPMHFFGGLLIGASESYLVVQAEKRYLLKIYSRIIRIVFVIMGVALVAMFWELSEFTFDVFLNTRLQSGIADTMIDMLLGLAGGTLATITYTLVYHPKLKSPTN